LRALRSDSRECPRRIGVGEGGGVGEVVKGLGRGGDRSRRRCVWTWDRVVVIGASAACVIPDHLWLVKLAWAECNIVQGGFTNRVK